jgi:hypothetical protein
MRSPLSLGRHSSTIGLLHTIVIIYTIPNRNLITICQHTRTPPRHRPHTLGQTVEPTDNYTVTASATDKSGLDLCFTANSDGTRSVRAFLGDRTLGEQSTGPLNWDDDMEVIQEAVTDLFASFRSVGPAFMKYLKSVSYELSAGVQGKGIEDGRHGFRYE